ncbi:MAG: DUF1572 family protein [Phycisphaerales bacterium]
MSSAFEKTRSSWLAELGKQKRWAEHAAGQVPDGLLHKAIAPGTNPVSVIMKHLAGSLRSRFTDFLTSDGEKEWRDREGEFIVGNEPRAEIMAVWERGWGVALGAVGALTEGDMERTVTIRSEPHTVPLAVVRAIGHSAYHTGQIMLVSRILAGSEGWAWATIAPGRSEEFRREMGERHGGR